MKLFENVVTDKERAFYGTAGAILRSCTFKGEADGESAVKECRDLKIENCDFHLRYPIWHVTGAVIDNCRLHESCRAPLWYCKDVQIKNTHMVGVKALRECESTTLSDVFASSKEIGWFCTDLKIKDSDVNGEYPFLKTRELVLENTRLSGKYSFQYVENATISGCDLDTKDAFWHAKNVTVTDSTVKGEYLGWYSENLTFIRCKISGTQPLCYCKNLTLIDCEMQGCDLSFERSEVKASVTGAIESVKNPVSGYIEADTIGQIILDMPTECRITAREQK